VGRLLVISRLALADIKRRRVQSALLLLMIVTTTTTLTIALALHKVTDSPFARTRAATRGPDIVAEINPPAGTRSGVTRGFAPLVHARGVAGTGDVAGTGGVAGTSGPYPIAFTGLSSRGMDLDAEVEGRDVAPAAVDQPVLTAGRWIAPGQAVIERGFADALRLGVGDTIRLGGRPFRVAGIAVSTAQCFYPITAPGLIWLTRSDADSLATPQQPVGYIFNLRLTDPSSAQTFENGPAATAFYNVTTNQPKSFLSSWQDIERQDFKVISVDQKVLLIVGTLLALLAIASIAVVVGSRVAEQTRRVGLLKAVGATPMMVAVVLLAENLLLALAAAAVGVTVGQLIAPVLTNLGNGLLGSPPTPPLTLTSAAEVLIVAIAVAASATIVPAIRGARTSTICALNDPAHPPRRRPALIALSARLPVPLLLAVRLVARRMRRSLLTAASLTIAVAMVVAALTLEHKVELTNQQRVAAVGGATVADRVTHLVFLLSAILVALAALNAIFTTWATVIDTQRPTALAKALGATPRQVTAGLAGAQLGPALLAAVLGIPIGLALYRLAGGNLHQASPPVLWLLAVIPATLIAVAVLTAIPARIGAGRAVADVLRSE
jgi:ABC-type antimicrobial peptide transport system permease subunit